MRLLRRWGYLLLMAASVMVCRLYLRDLTAAMIPLSFELSVVVYQRLVQNNHIKWLFPIGLVLAVLLGGLYYIADSILFSHSLRAAYRLQYAYVMGPVWAFGGLFFAACSPAGKRTV